MGLRLKMLYWDHVVLMGELIPVRKVMIKSLVVLFWAMSSFIVLLAWYKGKFK